MNIQSMPAEGTSNPYWTDEQDRSARMARLLAILARQPDRSSLAFFVGKSNNDNFVVYKWNTDAGEIQPFWLSTENVPAERRDNLNLAEEMLYGLEMTVTDSGEWLVNVRAEPIKMRKFNLTLDDNDTPALVGGVNGVMCVVESAYVQMKKGLLPDVDFVILRGRSIDSGEYVEEMITNVN
jgi:hypothetical protein